MIIIITGLPRVGKTALNTYFAKEEYLRYGHSLYKNCCLEIESLNLKRKNKLILPKQAPVYTSYESCIPTGYKKFVNPYWVNPYNLGIPSKENQITQFILPYGKLHITEGQKYWDSRESSSMLDSVSRYFETGGHFWLDFIIDVQRGKALDANIRFNAKRIIEVQKLVHDRDAYGRIKRSVWYCREFDSIQSYEIYVSGGVAPYRNTFYLNEGNIFDYYNSRSCKEDFVPPENKNFNLLEYKTATEIRLMSNAESIMYLNNSNRRAA